MQKSFLPDPNKFDRNISEFDCANFEIAKILEEITADLVQDGLLVSLSGYLHLYCAIIGKSPSSVATIVRFFIGVSAQEDPCTRQMVFELFLIYLHSAYPTISLDAAEANIKEIKQLLQFKSYDQLEFLENLCKLLSTYSCPELLQEAITTYELFLKAIGQHNSKRQLVLAKKMLTKCCSLPNLTQAFALFEVMCKNRAFSYEELFEAYGVLIEKSFQTPLETYAEAVLEATSFIQSKSILLAAL